jgi:hypothetical protein
MDMRGLVEHLEACTVKVAALPRAAADIAAPMMKETIKHEVMGSLTFLQTLAPATQVDRVLNDFTPNDPLVRSGGLQSSVEATAINAGEGEEAIAMAGTSDYRAKWLEYGTPNAQYPIPPRPAFMIGGLIVADEMTPLFSNMAKTAVE